MSQTEIAAPLTALLARTNGLPLLTKTQEVALAKRIERGDLRAKDALITANIRLVVSIACRFQGHGLALVDLVQEGMIGLIRAAEKFDWRRGFRFSTYASTWIRQALQRGLANTGRTIRIPAHMAKPARLVARAEVELEDRLGRRPTVEEIAEEASIAPDTVLLLRDVCHEPTSLDLPVGEGRSMTFGDLIAA
jgi:RNA polymerase primary sigma factor